MCVKYTVQKAFCIRAFAEKTILGTNADSIMHNI